MFGSLCTFRHEYKKFQQLLRHYYVVKLYCLESLYEYSVDQQSFVNEFETGVHKLPIFEQIHNAHSDYDRRSRHSLDIIEDTTEKDSAKSLFKEIALEIKKTFTSGSIDKSNESSKKKNSDGKAPSKSSIDEQE